MQSAIVRFDKVLHVHRVRENRYHPRHTIFSFVFNDKYEPYVTVPGWPDIDPGTTVTALLRKSGDWKSLIGWVNHDSGEVAVPDFKRSIGGGLLGCAFAVSWIAFFPAQFTLLRWGPAVIVLLLSMREIVQSRRQRMEAQQVEAMAGELLANLSLQRTASPPAEL